MAICFQAKLLSKSPRKVRAAACWIRGPRDANLTTAQVYTRVTKDRLVDAMGTFDGWDSDGPDEDPDGTDAEVIPLRPRWKAIDDVEDAGE